MNRGGITLWGFVGTIVLTSVLAGCQALGLTRINLPFMLGTMTTPDRDRAKVIGFGMHLLNGWLFAAVYAAAFRSWQRATWWLGALIGLVHALFVLTVAMPMLPGMHPRMASEQRGPTPTRQLAPPGFLARNYGNRTPISVVLAHLLYGAILGAFYRVRQDPTKQAACMTGHPLGIARQSHTVGAVMNPVRVMRTSHTAP